MKDKKNTSTIWFAASSISYLTAIIWYFALDNRSIAIMFGCIASAMLCLGAAQLNKEKANGHSTSSSNYSNTNIFD